VLCASTEVPDDVDALGVPVAEAGAVPDVVGLPRTALAAAGFRGRVGEALLLPRPTGPAVVAIGVGAGEGGPGGAGPGGGPLDAAGMRDAAAAFARAAGSARRLAVRLPDVTGAGVSTAAAAQAVVEGVLLARYHYPPLRRRPTGVDVAALTAVTAAQCVDEARRGVARGRITAGATALARDLANAPPAHLTASRLADVASVVAGRSGLGIEIFDRDKLAELGCGGLLGVNRGSSEPPRMVRLEYRPPGSPSGRLALVGKGVTYDSGGLSLKPSDGVHATMKTDMSGAGAVLAAMSALRALGCRCAVTGYLMCTDNMPSGTALNLGDVLTIRGGTTVEVRDTDAEGRLLLADGLVLATEEPVHAVVDVATLTGAAVAALGPEVAAVVGSSPALVAAVAAAAAAVDEPVWELPLARRYRRYLDSTIADLSNIGGEHAGALTAALFLAEFVGGVPWAHLDIAGPAQCDDAAGWRTPGGTGFGARLLVELALAFEAP
jgi:leucyl aminopeptidase